MRCHGLIRGLLPALALAVAGVTATPAAAADDVCLRDTPWGPQLAPYGQKMSFELIHRDGPSSVVGIRFTPLEGQYAKLYGFYRYNGSCVTEAMVIGAYASANQFRNVETLPKGDPVRYHEDFYSATTHATLDVSLTPPDYDEAKALALGLLK